jgi:signal transduction histidine kinase
VDDDPALLEALPGALALRMPELIVHTSDSAAAALARLAEVEYDAVVTDIKMPGMDGLTLLEKIGIIQPDTPTLMISGHGEHDLTIQALRGGAYDFIQKPIDRDYFVVALQRAIATHELRREVAAHRLALEAHARDLEEIVARRTAELVRATEAKDEFLGLISHEMRTPLTVITGGVHLLQRRSLSPEQSAEILNDVDREGQRLLRIVEDLLALAHASLEDPALSEPLSTRTLLHTTVETMRARSDREIIIRAEPNVPMIMGDPAYIERVLENLVSNSLKYSDPSQPIEISVTSDPIGDVLISVRDCGRPVSEEEAERIFERFYRSKSNSGSVSGAGMGLTVCKRMIEALSGKIWATPREGGGLEVHFTLPRYPDELAETYLDAIEAAGPVPA